LRETWQPKTGTAIALQLWHFRNRPRQLANKFAGQAKKEVERLNKPVGEFLRFAHPASLAIGRNDLNEIVASIVSLVGNQAAAQSVSIGTKLQKGLPEVSFDDEQIKQVLLNLAINALQATPEGGRVSFRTRDDG
jgi:signal transduction histidine kinase